MSRIGRPVHLLLVAIMVMAAHLVLPIAHVVGGHHHGAHPAASLPAAPPVGGEAVSVGDETLTISEAAGLHEAESDGERWSADLSCGCCPGCAGAIMSVDPAPESIAWGKGRLFGLRGDPALPAQHAERLPEPPRPFV